MKTVLAIVFVAFAALSFSQEAFAYTSCYTNCYGNTCYTNCY